MYALSAAAFDVASLMGDEVTLVNPAYETAVELKTLLRDMDLTRSSEDLERFSEEQPPRCCRGADS